jgi:hypothetical protein
LIEKTHRQILHPPMAEQWEEEMNGPFFLSILNGNGGTITRKCEKQFVSIAYNRTGGKYGLTGGPRA